MKRTLSAAEKLRSACLIRDESVGDVSSLCDASLRATLTAMLRP